MRNVLIIDDERPILKLLRRILKKAGYAVDTAETGCEGLEKSRSTRFDIVITDVLMTGLRGDEIAGQIRRAHRPAPVVIGISGTPWKLSDQVFDSILPKPFSRKSLLKTIETARL